MDYEDLFREKEVAAQEGSRLSIENEDLKVYRDTMIEAHAQELQAMKERFETDLVCPFNVGL